MYMFFPFHTLFMDLGLHLIEQLLKINRLRKNVMFIAIMTRWLVYKTMLI